MTVGTDAAIMKIFRFKAGRDSSVFWSKTSPVDALDVSISGAAPVTVTVSSRAPTSRITSSVMNCCVPIVSPLRSNVSEPRSAARTVYVPGSTATYVYSPAALVTAVRVLFVALLTSITSTPGITPFASLTAPRRPP